MTTGVNAAQCHDPSIKGCRPIGRCAARSTHAACDVAQHADRRSARRRFALGFSARASSRCNIEQPGRQLLNLHRFRKPGLLQACQLCQSVLCQVAGEDQGRHQPPNDARSCSVSCAPLRGPGKRKSASTAWGAGSASFAIAPSTAAALSPAETRQPHWESRMHIAARTSGSSSITATCRPRRSGVAGPRGTTRGASDARGTRSSKHEPRPVTERMASGWPSRRARRCTMARPNPSPWARSRAGLPTWKNSS